MGNQSAIYTHTHNIMPTLTSIPKPGTIGSLQESTIPQSGFIGPTKIGENVWIVRRLFSLGAGQKQGLSYEGLKGRLLGLLGETPFQHSALSTENNESTDDQLSEERRKVKDLCSGENAPFPLDSTMTIVRKNGKLTLHSVIPLDSNLLTEVKKLGQVSLLLVPNLQHWLFLQEWLHQYPEADVGLVQSACDEDLLDKMAFLKNHHGKVFHLKTGEEDLLCDHGLCGHHLEGAPLCLNEFLFYHTESGTLLASDSFYGGYYDNETPTWFARLWFKLTKYGSFRAARLPIYRTSRVISHGDRDKLIKSVNRMLEAWSIDQITFSHGTSPFNKKRLVESKLNCKTVADAYLHLWRSGLAAVTAN